MNKEQYFKFTNKIYDGKSPSIKVAANEVGATIPELKKFMKQFFAEEEEEDLDGNKSKNPFMELYRMLQVKASQHAADLLVYEKITEQQARKYLKDNGIDENDLEWFKKHAVERKKREEWCEEFKKKQEAGTFE